jgi:hypothetical protein
MFFGSGFQDVKWEDLPEIFIELDERAEGKFKIDLVKHADEKDWGG